MTIAKASDLPAGSVVADDTRAWFRAIAGIGYVWHGTDQRRRDDEFMQEVLNDGAHVLREGLA